MLFVYGPLSPAGFANGPSAAELHGEQIVAMIDYMDKGGYTRFEATAEADREWREHTDEIANMTVFPRAESWYMGANVPGKKRQSLNYPGACRCTWRSGQRSEATGIAVSRSADVEEGLLVSMKIRRVVTGRDARDASFFTSVEALQPVSVGGMHVINLWGTGDDGARVDNGPAEDPQLFPFFPNGSGHGSRFLVVHFAPDSSAAGPLPRVRAGFPRHAHDGHRRLRHLRSA